jgi:hypothetical protein
MRAVLLKGMTRIPGRGLEDSSQSEALVIPLEWTVDAFKEFTWLVERVS